MKTTPDPLRGLALLDDAQRQLSQAVNELAQAVKRGRDAWKDTWRSARNIARAYEALGGCVAPELRADVLARSRHYQALADGAVALAYALLGATEARADQETSEAARAADLDAVREVLAQPAREAAVEALHGTPKAPR